MDGVESDVELVRNRVIISYAVDDFEVSTSFLGALSCGPVSRVKGVKRAMKAPKIRTAPPEKEE